MFNSAGDLQNRGLLLPAGRFLAPIHPEIHFHARSPAPRRLASPCPQSPSNNFIYQFCKAASAGQSSLRERAAPRGLRGRTFLTLTSFQGKYIFLYTDGSRCDSREISYMTSINRKKCKNPATKCMI